MPDKLRRILCADDKEDIVEIVKLCLDMIAGIEVVCCGDGAAAVRLARETAPDMVLLDVMMPVADGRTALGAMKADPLLAHIPVVLMTARAQPSEIAEYLGMGAVAVIRKPFDPMRLAEEVLAIWGEHKAETAAAAD